jgi:diacylglycerol kinase (ATP)
MAGNPARRLAAKVQEAAAALRGEGIEATVAFTSGLGDGTALARKAMSEGRDLIMVCGGDGTINEVINGMGPTEVPLAVLPGGTANIVARELQLPLSIEKAASELPHWLPCRVALGRATWGAPEPGQQRYFLAVAGIGFDARIIGQLNLATGLRMGVASYAWEALRQIFQYDFPRFQCAVNGTKVSTTFAVVQRSLRYAGWLRLANATGLRQSHLACCLFNSSRRSRYFTYALAILTRTHHRLGDVSLLEGEPIVCTVEGPGVAASFEVDGELAGQLPVRFEVVPEALTVLAPRRFLNST